MNDTALFVVTAIPSAAAGIWALWMLTDWIAHRCPDRRDLWR